MVPPTRESRGRAPRVVTLSGSPRDCGREHGSILRTEILAALAVWRRTVEAGLRMRADRAVAEFLTRSDYMPAIEAFGPEDLEELAGIADGVGRPFEELFAYNLADEWAATMGGPTTGCTSLGVVGSRSATLIAQTFDLPPWASGSDAILSTTRSSSSTLILTRAGYLGAIGCNEHGIGIACNAVPQVPSRRSGLPAVFVARGVLRFLDFESALLWIASVPHASGQNYVLGGPRSVLTLECSASGVSASIDPRGFVTHTNHPIGAEQFDMTSPSETDSRLRKVAVDGAIRIPFTAGDARSVLDSLPINRASPGPDGLLTVARVVMHLSKPPVMEVASGATGPWSTMTFGTSVSSRRN